MAMILRKVWGSVLSRSASGSNRRSPFEIENSSYSSRGNSLLLLSMGAVDRLPTDILMLILRLLGPRDAARMSPVFRSWKVLVSDNMLWIFFIKNGKDSFESVLFAETHLRLGFPCRNYSDHSPQLSFMNIYAERQKVPGSIIIDELRKETRTSCQVAGEGLFTLSKERFQAAEILFQPQIGGVRVMGLHRAVALCMDHCIAAEVAIDEGWYKTIVLVGGTACLPGLPERLEKELQKNLPTYMSEGIKVIPPSYGADSAWFGAKIVSNVSTFSEAWCMSKKHFHQKSRSNTSAFNAPW